MSSTSIPTQLLNNLTTASSHLLHHHHHSTSTTTIRLLSTYPRFRSSHRLALPSKPVNTWSTRGAGGRWVHPQPATPTRTRTLSTDMSTGSRTTSKLMTPEDVPLVIPTHPRPTVHNTSADLPENPCLNHPEFETGKPQGQDSAPSTSTTKSFMKSNDDGLNWDFGLSSKNKSRTHGSSSSSAAETDQGLSDRELNEMAMRRLGVKGGSGSGSASPVNSTSGSTSTSGSSHTLFPSAQLPSSTSNSSSSTQASASASSPYLEIEQESIGRSTRPLPGSSHSSSSSSASSATATASAGSTAKPAPAGGIAARKAGRTIGLKGKKNAITLTPSAVSRLSELAEPAAAAPIAPPNSSSGSADASPSASPQLLRISVRNRGCAGLAYHLSYLPLNSISKFDEIVEQDGVKVLVDSRALFSVVGSEMDWVEDRMSARFVFKNPNVKDACGCGESFHV